MSKTRSARTKCHVQSLASLCVRCAGVWSSVGTTACTSDMTKITSSSTSAMVEDSCTLVKPVFQLTFHVFTYRSQTLVGCGSQSTCAGPVTMPGTAATSGPLPTPLWMTSRSRQKSAESGERLPRFRHSVIRLRATRPTIEPWRTSTGMAPAPTPSSRRRARRSAKSAARYSSSQRLAGTLSAASAPSSSPALVRTDLPCRRTTPLWDCSKGIP